MVITSNGYTQCPERNAVGDAGCWDFSLQMMNHLCDPNCRGVSIPTLSHRLGARVRARGADAAIMRVRTGRDYRVEIQQVKGSKFY